MQWSKRTGNGPEVDRKPSQPGRKWTEISHKVVAIQADYPEKFKSLT